MSDVMTIPCPSCQMRYHVKAELAGKKFKCKKCGKVLQTPGPAPTAKTGTPTVASAKPASAQGKAAATPGKQASTQPGTRSAQARPQAAVAKPAPAPQPATAASRLLDEELAAPAAAAGATPDVFEVKTHAPSASEAKTADTRAKRECPHCGAKIEADLVYCTECGLAVNKKYGGVDRDDNRADSKEWLIVLAGIGGALVSSPLFFLVVPCWSGARWP